MSTPNPLDTAAAMVDLPLTAGGVSETMLDAMKKRGPLAIDKTESLGDFDFSTGSPPLAITYGATGYLYFYNADDTTTADDGVTCLVSADGRRYILADMSAIAISSVLAIDNDPPASPSDGDAYIVSTSPTGAWVGHAKDIALYTPRGWVFAAPKVGCALLNVETGLNVQYDEAGDWGAMATSITTSGVAPGQLLFSMGLSVEAQQNAPPGSPVAGDGLYYLVGLSPTGAWSGKSNKIATYDSTSNWVFLDPYDGAQIFNKASDAALTWFDATGDWRPTWPIASVTEGRLTLSTGVPITTTDQTAKATVYFTPFRGNTIALYVNGGWALRTFTEKSLSIAGFTTGKNYDVFGYDASGVLAIESLVWTSDTVRATALALQDGVLVKSGDATRKYLGTFYTTATGQTEDSAAKRYVWNYYNRAPRSMRVQDNNNWTYGATALRQARATATNQLEFVVGVAEDAISARLSVTAKLSTSAVEMIATIGLDSTTTASSDVVATKTSSGTYAALHAMFDSFVAAGRHRLVWLEGSDNSATSTFLGVGSGMSGILQG